MRITRMSSAILTMAADMANMAGSDVDSPVHGASSSGDVDSASVKLHLSVPEPTGVLPWASAVAALAFMVKKRRSTVGGA